MKPKHWIILMVIISVVSATLTFWFIKRHSPVNLSTSATGQSAAPPLIVTASPARHTFTVNVPWIGTVESKASVELTALTAGRIAAINVEDQAQVSNGQIVARLGGPAIDARLEGLASEVASLKFRLELARQTVERLEVSLKSQLATKDQVSAAQDEQARLDAQLNEARLQLGTLENQMSISATMGGIFTNRNVSKGQDVVSGQVIGEIIDSGRLRILAAIFPPQGVDLQGKEANVHIGETGILSGVVQRVLPKSDSSGAIIVWIEGPQIDAQLLPGQTVAGDMVAEVRADRMAVPESAIVYDSDERPYIFIMKDSGYSPQSVRLGLTQDGLVEVLSGLEQGQPVVTQGAYELFYRRFNEQFKVED
jgi:RND family efflux transporter MFP subunit